MRLVALDAEASAAGLSVGQSLADARALCPALVVREIDRLSLEQTFADFADWHSNASPIVSVLIDKSAWGDLLLDITGVSHLFGGEAAMLQHLMQRLADLGFAVTGAVASSVGAAWALAHFSAPQVVDNHLEDVLAPLPVAALRLDDEQVRGLNHLGLKRIGQLYGRDRNALQARFGASLLLRLDQAICRAEERIVPRLPLPERLVERRFPEPIGLIDDVLGITRDLAFQLSGRLEQEGAGAQAFHLFLYRVDHRVMTLSVNAARATRDPHHIARLFANHAERLEGDYDAGFGIDMIRLAASSISPLPDVQIGVFEVRDGTADLAQLCDRMTSRLGPLSVLRSSFVNTHIPERAVRLEPMIAGVAERQDDFLEVQAVRPLRLLPQPELVTVAFAEVPDGPPPSMVWRRIKYHFVRTSGPERIGVEWWNLPTALVEIPRPDELDLPGDAQDKPPVIAINDGIELTRDYYIAEDEGGRRFWLFREGLYGLGSEPRWYLHGFFA